MSRLKPCVAAAVAAAISVTALVACSSAPPAKVTHSSTAPTKSAAPQTPLDLHPGDGWSVLGGVLVKGGYNAVDYSDVTGPIQVFTPESGAVLVDGAALVSPEEVISQSWTVAGPADGNYLVGAIEVRKPAHGLDPESYVTSLVQVDVRSGAATVSNTSDVITSACKGALTGLVGSTNDAVAAQIYAPIAGGACGSNVVLAGWNPKTGTQLWTSDMVEQSSAFGSVVGSTWVDSTVQNTSCGTFKGLSVSTGAVLWTFDSHSVLVDRVCGQIGITDFVGNGAAYDGRSQLGLAYHVKVDYSDVTADFDAITGKKIFIREPLQLFDPMTRYAVVYGQDFGAGRTLGIVVYDTATGDTIYSMDVAKAVSLDAAPVGIMDGRLFLKTSDQSLEIDVKSGEVLSESLGAYPVAVAGKYAYFTNGELVPLSQVDSYRPAA